MTDSPVRIGPYELVSHLGVGGMAETYLAVRRGPGDFSQRVCLKRVRRDLDRDPEFVRQFLAEAAIAAKLRHAAIAQVLDFGCDGEDYYLALELVEGVDLRGLLEQHPGGLPPETVLHIAIELATALDFAHRAGGDAAQGPVVHRDVSASNALLSVEGEVKLADFGIARPLAGPQHTQTGVVKGKVPYLAPEYARSGRFDARCDLFSLGVLLYEAACGERPHDGTTDLETLERALAGTRRALAERAPALPAALCRIIEHLLEADPELRVSSAAALLEMLLGLPISGRARRELGALVAAARRASAPPAPLQRTQPMRGPRARQPDAPSGDTELLNPAPAPAGAHSSSAMSYARPRTGPLLSLAFALAFALSVFGLWLARRSAAPRAVAPVSGASTATPATTTASPRAANATPPPVILAPNATGDASEASREPGATAPAPAGNGKSSRNPRAQVEVIMLPYGGEIFVDGKHAGTAPVTLTLTPGEHEVVGKQPSGTLTRRVRVAPGERRQLVLR